MEITSKKHLDAIYDAGRNLRLVKFDDKPIDFIDDWGFEGGRWYVIHHEFEPSKVVHADSDCSAWEAYTDECPTISSDEVIEAYGFYTLEANGKHYVISDVDDIGEEMIVPGIPQLRNYVGDGFDTESDAQWAALKVIEENQLDLIEGFEYQSNASGTGIVDHGHYVGMFEIDVLRLSFRSAE